MPTPHYYTHPHINTHYNLYVFEEMCPESKMLKEAVPTQPILWYLFRLLNISTNVQIITKSISIFLGR